MRSSLAGCLTILAAVCISERNSCAATITVTTSSRTTQTIDGFGVFGSMHPWWDNGPFYTDAFLSLYIDTLGLTLLRTELQPQPEQTNLYTEQIPYLKAIMAKAQASKEPLKVFASIWSPPGRMKTGGSATGGHLLDDSLDAYGVYVANYVKKFNQDMGYNLYAISPQNEPALCTGYNSSCSLPDSFAPVVIHTAHQIKNLNVPVWVHYADNIPWGNSGWQGPVISQVCQDNVADSICQIMSMHYTQNAEVDSGSDPNNGNRNTFYWLYKQCQGADTGTGWQNSRHYNKGKKSRMWNTEWGGYFGTWNDTLTDETGAKPGGAWTCARAFFFTLKSGFNAITYWQGCDDGANNTPYTNPVPGQHYGMMYYFNNQPTPGPIFYVLKCFYRYIRPGAVRVNCTSDDSTHVNALAFVHDSLRTATVVLINYAATQQSATINGTGLPSTMDVYQTSPTQNCVKTGTVTQGGSVTLPPQSITTLCNTPSVGTLDLQMRPGGAAHGASAKILFDIKGRIVGARGGTDPHSEGVYIVKGGPDGKLKTGLMIAKRQ